MSLLESKIRDFLADRIGDLPNFIVNLEESRAKLSKVEPNFLAIPPDDGGPNAREILKFILAKQNLRGINSLYDIELIDKELPLLSTGKSGFQPSADILAYNTELGVMFLLEIKRSAKTEREAVTQLAAYTSGLQNKFWGLSSLDHVWIPISTEWRTIVKAAFANEAAWGNRVILPMDCKVELEADEIKKIKLELIDLLPELDETVACSQFAWHCFDSLEICFPAEIPEARTFIEFISATASRLGFSGFVLYGTALGAEILPYPHSFVIGVQNPLLSALKSRQLQIVMDHAGIIEMRKEIKKNLWCNHDIDFCSMKDIWLHETQQDNGNNKSQIEDERCVSIQEMSQASANRTSPLWDEIRFRLKSMGIDYEIGSPNIHALLTSLGVGTPLLEHVGFFGLMQQAIYERLHYEFHHADEHGDGLIIGDMGNDPFVRASSWNMFLDFMALMNYEHDCQVDYDEDESE
ncbi:MAG: hypothetical protein E3J72_00940 [Planctomycetota bacterium]|nr:MAG: hypothetical protein E3J72_00940 [Planctomycetota bacterium]